MSLPPRAAILSVSGAHLTAGERALLSECQPWGVILMGRNCVSRDQVRRLVDGIWEALGRSCLVFIDQEGGRVARLKAPEWPVFPAGKAYGDLHARNAEAGIEAAWLGHRLIAHELAAVSIHANCAPVIDVPAEGAHNVIGDRAFSSEPKVVAALGRAALAGLRDGGVAGVIKHMPGHGKALVDSHKALPRVLAGDNELAADFAAFAGVADAPMAMTAHIAYEAFDPDAPATLSPKVVSEVIRHRIGFDGLLMTDDIGMDALGGDLGTRAKGAHAAGCDVVLHCAGFVKDPDDILAEMRLVGEAVPELSGLSLERARHAEHFAALATPFDAAGGWKRFAELMALTGVVA